MKGGIPTEIGNSKSLKEIHLGTNYLSGTLPSEIGKLSTLGKSLIISVTHDHDMT